MGLGSLGSHKAEVKAMNLIGVRIEKPPENDQRYL